MMEVQLWVFGSVSMRIVVNVTDSVGWTWATVGSVSFY